MQCQTCGDGPSPAFDECQRCRTPLGHPAVWPGVSTYAVRGLGTAASIAVGAATLLYLPPALFPIVGMAVARSAAEQLDRDLLMVAAVAEILLHVPYLLAALTAGVLLIIWTWRARKNLDAFPGARPTMGPGWAIAGWLVPLANFVVPARVVASVARDSLWRRSAGGLVGVWWAAWLVFLFADRIVSKRDEQRYLRLTELPRNDAEFQTYVRYYQDAIGPRLVPLLACLAAGISLIVLIRRISAAQQDRIARAALAWPVHAGRQAPGAPLGYPPEPTGPSHQGPADPTVASPQAPPGAGGTIGT